MLYFRTCRYDKNLSIKAIELNNHDFFSRDFPDLISWFLSSFLRLMIYVLKLAQQENSIKSSWADSHIKVGKFSNDLGTDSVPILGCYCPATALPCVQYAGMAKHTKGYQLALDASF
jgi:hypothetical protein